MVNVKVEILKGVLILLLSLIENYRNIFYKMMV